MKRMWIVFACAVCLCGCGAEQTMETISDDLAVLAEDPASQIAISVADEDAVTFFGEDGSRLYLCDDYTVTVQTLSGGDIDQSMRTVTGFPKDSLTVIKTEKDGVTQYEYAWSTAGENEDQICRGVILDDGTYHYAVTVMADYSQAADLQDTWQAVFESVILSTD